MQPNKTLLLVSMKTQSKVSICMAHGHMHEARQLHHGRFRHIKPNTNCQSKGRGRQGRVSGWGRKRLAETLGCLQTSQRKYLPPRCPKFSSCRFFSLFFLSVSLSTNRLWCEFYAHPEVMSCLTLTRTCEPNLWLTVYTTVWGDWFTPHTAVTWPDW